LQNYFADDAVCTISDLATELTFMRIRTLTETMEEEDKEVDLGEEEEVKNKNQKNGKVENKTTFLNRCHRLEICNIETTVIPQIQTSF
jgi:hypothetical protein